MRHHKGSNMLPLALFRRHWTTQLPRFLRNSWRDGKWMPRYSGKKREVEYRHTLHCTIESPKMREPCVRAANHSHLAPFQTAINCPLAAVSCGFFACLRWSRAEGSISGAPQWFQSGKNNFIKIEFIPYFESLHIAIKPRKKFGHTLYNNFHYNKSLKLAPQ